MSAGLFSYFCTIKVCSYAIIYVTITYRLYITLGGLIMNNKSQKYIIIFSLVLIAVIAFIFFSKLNDDTPSTGSGNVTNNATTAKPIPDATKGSPEATINANIIFREIDFSLSMDDVLAKEKKLEDTLDNPAVAESADGYTYITYKSNPDKPLSYNGFSVASTGTTCLTYVFNNGHLEEARLQFGALDSNSTTNLVSNINSQYGEYTFFRSTNGTQTYWWKSNTAWFMLTSDSVGTTLFFRRV